MGHLSNGWTAEERRIVLAAVVGTTASVFPAFLTGAVGVQLRDSIEVSDQQLGVAIGAFFVSAALGSAALGGVAERLGGPRAMQLGLTMTVITGLTIAAFGRSALSLTLLLLIAGGSNALTQPAANLMLADGLGSQRLGLALAFKQSGMPMATLLGGLAVPSLAITLGWQWAFVAGAVMAGIALIALSQRNRGQERVVRRAVDATERPRPDLPSTLLVTYALVGGLGAAAAGSLVGFLVSGGVESGIDPAVAGLLLTAGAVVGITARIVQGRLADSGRILPIKQLAVLFALGSAGMVILSIHTPISYWIGITLAFGCGWAWPGLFNLSVIRNNPSAPGAATGVSQTGVYIGAGAGPAVGGWIIAGGGYPALWLSGAAALVLATGISVLLRRLVRSERERDVRLPT